MHHASTDTNRLTTDEQGISNLAYLAFHGLLQYAEDSRKYRAIQPVMSIFSTEKSSESMDDIRYRPLSLMPLHLRQRQSIAFGTHKTAAVDWQLEVENKCKIRLSHHREVDRSISNSQEPLLIQSVRQRVPEMPRFVYICIEKNARHFEGKIADSDERKGRGKKNLKKHVDRENLARVQKRPVSEAS